MYEIVASKIIASKLYKASTRKSSILNAMQNQKNQGLMIQLAEYLDDEYQRPELIEGKPEAKPEPEGEAEESKTSIRPSEGGGAGGGGGQIAGLGEGMSLMDAPESEEDLDKLMSEEGGDEGAGDESFDFSEPEVTDESAEASTKITKQPIKACDEITVDQLEGLKSSLNLVEDTQGVSRIMLKNNELWLYYDDDKNLNNIMVAVIEAIAQRGLDWAKFNRLARSDNAMVFEVVKATADVEPISEDK